MNTKTRLCHFLLMVAMSANAAIDAANAGDVLRVAPGTYSPISTDNKSIVIESTGGAEVTIIDGGGKDRCATLG